MGVINTPGPWSLKYKPQAGRSSGTGTGNVPLWKRSTAARRRMYNGNRELWRGKPMAAHLKRLRRHADRYGWEFERPATALDAVEAYVEIMCGEHGRDYTPIDWS
jgi:hypothetical protein